MVSPVELVDDFDRETRLTRRLLERIPQDQLDWKPHQKSTALHGLARHLAHMLTWGTLALTQPASDTGDRPAMPPTGSIDELLALFDRNVETVRALLSAQTEADLATSWTLNHQGHPLMTSSRAAAIRSMILHHQIHHRGQLSVYLRLLDISVPAIYGPSADEAM